MTKAEGRHSTSATGGIVLHAPRFYDFLAWLVMLGREGAFREKVIDLARVRPGDCVLDVGCGTGTLAIAAKRRIGPTGKVFGIDASPEMIKRAGTKMRASISPSKTNLLMRCRFPTPNSMSYSAH